MKIFSRMGKMVKPFVNFPLWMNTRQLKADGKQLVNLAKTVFKKSDKPHRVETFEQAIARLELTPADVKKRMKTFLWQSIAFVVIALALLAYTIWLAVGGFVFASVLSLVLTGLAGTNAMRVHYYYFQMKQQRLGCSIREWFGYCLAAIGLKAKMPVKGK